MRTALSVSASSRCRTSLTPSAARPSPSPLPLVRARARRLTKLDAWKTALLLTIKRSIAEEPALT